MKANQKFVGNEAGETHTIKGNNIGVSAVIGVIFQMQNCQVQNCLEDQSDGGDISVGSVGKIIELTGTQKLLPLRQLYKEFRSKPMNSCKNLYASGMISGMTADSNKVIPSIQFLQSGNNLLVQKMAESNVNWSEIKVTNGVVPLFVAGSPNIVEVGDVISSCHGQVTIVFRSELINTFTFS